MFIFIVLTFNYFIPSCSMIRPLAVMQERHGLPSSAVEIVNGSIDE